jgi:hypothetical protein
VGVESDGGELRGGKNSRPAALIFLFECFIKPVARIVGNRGGLGIAENIDGLFRRIYNDSALFAFHKVLFDFGSNLGGDPRIEVIRNLFPDLRALHDASP